MNRKAFVHGYVARAILILGGIQLERRGASFCNARHDPTLRPVLRWHLAQRRRFKTA